MVIRCFSFESKKSLRKDRPPSRGPDKFRAALSQWIRHSCRNEIVASACVPLCTLMLIAPRLTLCALRFLSG